MSAKREKTKRGFFRTLPEHLRSETVLRFFEFLRRAHRLFVPRRKKRLCDELLDALRRGKGETRSDTPPVYAENQLSLSAMPYGSSTMKKAGCEVLAAYNALLTLEGHAPAPDTLRRVFERDGMVQRGHFGTAPSALRDFFRRLDYRVESARDETELARIAESAEVLLAVVWNDRGELTAGVHSVCLTRTPSGWVAHNVRGDGHPTAAFPAVEELLRNAWGGRAKLICAYAVSRRES